MIIKYDIGSEVAVKSRVEKIIVTEDGNISYTIATSDGDRLRVFEEELVSSNCRNETIDEVLQIFNEPEKAVAVSFPADELLKPDVNFDTIIGFINNMYRDCRQKLIDAIEGLKEQ